MSDLNINLFRFFNDFAGQSPLVDTVIVFFANYLAYLLVTFFVVTLLASKLTLTSKWACAFSALLAGIVARAGAVAGIRYFYHHLRPFLALPDTHALFFESGYSFPSGHATFFFAVSAVVYSYNRKFGIWFFSLSFVMGIARIMAGVHFPLDILGGAFIGAVIGFVTVLSVKKLENCFPKLFNLSFIK